MSSERPVITRNIPMKIALDLPKSLFTQKLLVIQHNAFCRMFYSDCSKWPSFTDPQKQRRQCHWLIALSITPPRWSLSRHSHTSMIR